MKKRKASTSSDSSAPKKMKPLTSSFDNPIDVVPISTMPSKDLVPFDEDYVIPSESDEDIPSAASSEQMDEEIEVDAIPSTPIVSSPMPQFTAEEAGVEEMSSFITGVVLPMSTSSSSISSTLASSAVN